MNLLKKNKEKKIKQMSKSYHFVNLGSPSGRITSSQEKILSINHLRLYADELYDWIQGDEHSKEKKERIQKLIDDILLSANTIEQDLFKTN